MDTARPPARASESVVMSSAAEAIASIIISQSSARSSRRLALTTALRSRPPALVTALRSRTTRVEQSRLATTRPPSVASAGGGAPAEETALTAALALASASAFDTGMMRHCHSSRTRKRGTHLAMRDAPECGGCASSRAARSRAQLEAQPAATGAAAAT